MKDRSERFSVLMSVYHKEDPRHFDLALESNLVNQTIIPDEFVLVCDGPLNDALDKVINKYEKISGERIKVVRLEKNCGIATALNKGIALCSYEYIARSDSDDVCEKTRFEKELDFLIGHSEVAAVGSDIDEFMYDVNEPVRVKQMPRTSGELYKMAKRRNPINHMTVMYRRSVVLEMNGYDITLPPVEDYDLWIRMLLGGYQIANINEILVHVRIGNGMVDRRGNKKYIETWRRLNRYMREKKMISAPRYAVNMISIRAFVYMRSGMRDYVYYKILRKKHNGIYE